jgi:microcystin-dependent protein
MATVTGLTADRMLEIEANSVVDGEVVGGNLILTQHDGSTIDAGPVIGPKGDPGPPGPAAVSAIPGEVKLWSGSALPDIATYGKWVWADGAVYPVASHPKAAAHIASQWRTFAGASDPGAPNFRVPDLRGLVGVGMDAMPGGTRANRMTRAVAITIAARTGEETHIVTVPEMPAHAHPVSDPTHVHTIADNQHGHQLWGGANFLSNAYASGAVNVGYLGDPAAEKIIWAHGGTQPGHSNIGMFGAGTGISVGNSGSNGAHENVQPTVFVPYIVYLDVV